jgi:hypothetical protein
MTSTPLVDTPQEVVKYQSNFSDFVTNKPKLNT